MKGVIATIAALLLSTTAHAETGRPTMVAIEPTPFGSCYFTVAGTAAPCRAAAFLEDRQQGKSMFIIDVNDETMVGFRGGLAKQRGLVATLMIDSIRINDTRDPVWVRGACFVNLESLERPDVRRLRCSVTTPRGPMSFEIRNATANTEN